MILSLLFILFRFIFILIQKVHKYGYVVFIQNVRQFGKHVLEQISNTKGLSCGLEFLCSSEDSLSAVFLGMRHALKLVIVTLM